MKNLGGPLLLGGVIITILGTGLHEKILNNPNSNPPAVEEDDDGAYIPTSNSSRPPSTQPNKNPDGTDQNQSNDLPDGSHTDRNTWIQGLQNAQRGEEGALYFTSYGQDYDSTPDSNTLAKRGFSNNLLREGSVALSPDIYNRYRPPIGASVYVNGNLIGYYEDRTPESYNGMSYGNTIDVYDPNGSLGSVLKKAPSGSYELSFGPPRTQITNP